MWERIIVGVLTAAIVGIGSKLFEFQQRISSTEVKVEQIQQVAPSLEVKLEQLQQRIVILEEERKLPKQPQPLPKHGSVINMDDPKVIKTTLDTPMPVSSPIRIEWSGGLNKVIQVHSFNKNGNLVFPLENDIHQENSTGITIPLEPGKYEVKAWEPGTESFKATWIQVRGE